MRLYTDKVSPGIHGCHTSPFSSPEPFALSGCFSSWKALFALFVAEYLPLIRSFPTKGTPWKKISKAPNLPRLQPRNPLLFISLQKPCFCLPPQVNTCFPVHPSTISISNHHHGWAAGVHHTSAHGASWEASPTSNENALQLLLSGHEVPFVFFKKMVIINHSNKPLTLGLKRGGLHKCPHTYYIFVFDKKVLNKKIVFLNIGCFLNHFSKIKKPKMCLDKLSQK